MSAASHEEIMRWSGRYRCVFQMGDLIVSSDCLAVVVEPPEPDKVATCFGVWLPTLWCGKIYVGPWLLPNEGFVR